MGVYVPMYVPPNEEHPGVGGILLPSPRSAQRTWRLCGEPFSAKVASKRYGAVCVGIALDPEGEKWKRINHSLGTLWPSTSGE